MQTCSTRECGGNPLILTYLVNAVQHSPTKPVSEVIEGASDFDGDMDGFYNRAFAVPLEDAETRRLLALLCRAGPVIPGTWLQSWPEADAVEDLHQRVLAPFMREEDGNLLFIHSSLVSFLVFRTRSRLPGADHAADEEGWHSALADRTAGRTCGDALGRAHVFHLSRAGRFGELLDVATSSWLREPVRAFLPYALARPVLLEALRAAWSLGEYSHVARRVLLDGELEQRSAHLDAGELAGVFLELDRPELALAQMRANGLLLADDDAALAFARELWFYAKDKGSAGLVEAARRVYADAKPIGHLIRSEPLEIGRYDRELVDVLTGWCGAAPLFEAMDEVVNQVRGLAIAPPRDGDGLEAAAVSTGLLFAALRTVVRAKLGDPGEASVLAAIVQSGRPEWELAARVTLARSGVGPVSTSTLLDSFARCGDEGDLALALAERLYARGEHGASKAIMGNLANVAFDPHFGDEHTFGYSDVTFTASLACARELLGLDDTPPAPVENDEDEAVARVEMASRRLGGLRALAMRGNLPGDLRGRFREVLLYATRPVERATYDRHMHHFVVGSRGAVFEELRAVASRFGAVGARALCDVVLEVERGGAPSVLGVERRQFALAFLEAGVLDKKAAVQLGLSWTADADDEDPRARQEACLGIACFAKEAGDEGWEQWVYTGPDLLLREREVTRTTGGLISRRGWTRHCRTVRRRLARWRLWTDSREPWKYRGAPASPKQRAKCSGRSCARRHLAQHRWRWR